MNCGLLVRLKVAGNSMRFDTCIRNSSQNNNPCFICSLQIEVKLDIGTHFMYYFVFQIRDDYQKCHPCLINFDKLPENERMYNMSLAEETLKYA